MIRSFAKSGQGTQSHGASSEFQIQQVTLFELSLLLLPCRSLKGQQLMIATLKSNGQPWSIHTQAWIQSFSMMSTGTMVQELIGCYSNQRFQPALRSNTGFQVVSSLVKSTSLSTELKTFTASVSSPYQ